MATIPASRGKMMDAKYTVRAGYTAYLLRPVVQVGSVQSAETRVFIADASTTSAPFGKVINVGTAVELDTVEEFNLKAYPAIPEKHDIWATAKADGGSGSQVYVAYDILLLDNANTTPQ